MVPLLPQSTLRAGNIISNSVLNLSAVAVVPGTGAPLEPVSSSADCILEDTAESMGTSPFVQPSACGQTSVAVCLPPVPVPLEQACGMGPSGPPATDSAPFVCLVGPTADPSAGMGVTSIPAGPSLLREQGSTSPGLLINPPWDQFVASPSQAGVVADAEQALFWD